MTDYLVSMESAWVVRDVRSLDDAIGIAIGEAGKRLNPAAKYVDVETGLMACPYCEEELSCALVVANTGLVGLVLEMKVFRAESAEHAERIAKSVVGKALGDVPLKVLEVEPMAESRLERAEPAQQPRPKQRPEGQGAGQGRHPFKR